MSWNGWISWQTFPTNPVLSGKKWRQSSITLIITIETKAANILTRRRHILSFSFFFMKVHLWTTLINIIEVIWVKSNNAVANSFTTTVPIKLLLKIAVKNVSVSNMISTLLLNMSEMLFTRYSIWKCPLVPNSKHNQQQAETTKAAIATKVDGVMPLIIAYKKLEGFCICKVLLAILMEKMIWFDKGDVFSCVSWNFLNCYLLNSGSERFTLSWQILLWHEIDCFFGTIAKYLCRMLIQEMN